MSYLLTVYLSAVCVSSSVSRSVHNQTLVPRMHVLRPPRTDRVHPDATADSRSVKAFTIKIAHMPSLHTEAAWLHDS